MADLTPLDEKLGEVLGLAQAAQAATKTVRGLEGADAVNGLMEIGAIKAMTSSTRSPSRVSLRQSCQSSMALAV